MNKEHVKIDLVSNQEESDRGEPIGFTYQMTENDFYLQISEDCMEKEKRYATIVLKKDTGDKKF